MMTDLARRSRLLGVLSSMVLVVLVVTAGDVSADRVHGDAGLAWASERDLTSEQFAAAFEKYSSSGYMMVDIEAYPHGTAVRYAMVWRQNKDKRGWAARRDMTSEEYGKRWEEYRAKGFRPIDVEAYQAPGGLRWAGIWVQNREQVTWGSYRNDDAAAYAKRFDAQRAAGFRLVDIEVYDTPQGLRYASIWVQNADKRDWAQLRDMSREKYQSEIDARQGQGWRVVDFESYRTPQGQRYAAIWERTTLASQTRTDRTELEFANLWRQYRDEGFRLVDFERYNTANGPRYAGVWMENDSRFRYARKGTLDKIITTYQTANTIPGISVAIIRDGNVIYRRGFGFADVDGKKVAHGETVYNTASLSKVIGGTLAAKLENERRLRNGSRFTLDLAQQTSTYLSKVPNANGSGTVSLPAAHGAHTVEQLLSHRGCVVHYNTKPSIANQTAHYSNAVAAVQSIWGVGLVTTCTVGTTFSYSTHAFTFVAAVLERATGRTINQLLQNELFVPYDLGSMRVQYATSTLPANYDRAIPYTNSNNPTSYSNNSWKVIGGGIESNAVDVARFGWKVLNGEIVTPNVRDNRVWQVGGPGGAWSMGWNVRNVGPRRVAEWNGRTTGARSFLRVYRDDGLVIVVLTNRDNHSVQDVVDALGNAVLN